MKSSNKTNVEISKCYVAVWCKKYTNFLSTYKTTNIYTQMVSNFLLVKFSTSKINEDKFVFEHPRRNPQILAEPHLALTEQKKCYLQCSDNNIVFSFLPKNVQFI